MVFFLPSGAEEAKLLKVGDKVQIKFLSGAAVDSDDVDGAPDLLATNPRRAFSSSQTPTPQPHASPPSCRPTTIWSRLGPETTWSGLTPGEYGLAWDKRDRELDVMVAAGDPDMKGKVPVGFVITPRLTADYAYRPVHIVEVILSTGLC